MCVYSQAITGIILTYTTDHASSVDFKDSDQFLETKEENDFEFDLELS
jgi:hypothetical protein